VVPGGAEVPGPAGVWRMPARNRDVVAEKVPPRKKNRQFRAEKCGFEELAGGPRPAHMNGTERIAGLRGLERGSESPAARANPESGAGLTNRF
jgi:hypothetical protein